MMLQKISFAFCAIALIGSSAAQAGGFGLKGGLYKDHVFTGCMDNKEIGLKLGFFFDRTPKCDGGLASPCAGNFANTGYVAQGNRYNPLASNCCAQAPVYDPCVMQGACPQWAPAERVFAEAPLAPAPVQPIYLLVMPAPVTVINNTIPAQGNAPMMMAAPAQVEMNKPVRGYW